MSSIQFDPVTDSQEHIQLLFELFNQRQHRISAEKIISLEDHRAFVRSHPYREWWFTYVDELLIGNVYLGTDNAIGINLLPLFESHCHSVIEKILSEYTPLPGIPSVRNKNFHVNVAPMQSDRISSLVEYGWIKIQETYADH